MDRVQVMLAAGQLEVPLRLDAEVRLVETSGHMPVVVVLVHGDDGS